MLLIPPLWAAKIGQKQGGGEFSAPWDKFLGPKFFPRLRICNSTREHPDVYQKHLMPNFAAGNPPDSFRERRDRDLNMFSAIDVFFSISASVFLNVLHNFV